MSKTPPGRNPHPPNPAAPYITASRTSRLRAFSRTALGVTLAGSLVSMAAQAQQASPATSGSVQLPTLSVDGQDGAAPAPDYRTDRAANPKLTEKLLDTPQSVTVVSSQQMKDEGITTLRDALRTVAGISLAAGEGGSQGDNLTLRGFSARSDIFLDGLRDFGSYYRDPFNMQSVEVLKGPDSTQFGRGSTGGTVNQVSKTPVLDTILAGSLAYGTDTTRRVTGDINMAVPELGQGAALRLNVMGNSGFVTGRDGAKNERYGVAPSLALGIGTPTRITISALHQSEDDRPDYGLPFLLGQPAPVNNRNFYGFGSDYLRTDANIITADVQHDFNDAITVENQFRYGNYYRNARITEPQIVGAATLTSAPSLAALRVNRNEITTRSVETSIDDQLMATSRFATGPIQHTLITGLEVASETSDPTRRTWTGVPTTSLLNPSEGDAFAGTPTISARTSSTVDTVALFATDTLKFDEHWSLTGGIRWDHIDSSFRQTIGTIQSYDRTDSMPSGRAALVYKPVENGSFYASYGTSFNPSAEQLSLAANNANLAPEENETYEVGTKWSFFHDRIDMTAALYQTEKTNARVTDPTNSSLYILSGDQKVQGAELAVNGRITDEWLVNASYAYMNGLIDKTSPATQNQQGRALANVPHHTFNLWTTYQLTRALQVGGGASAVSQRAVTSTPQAATNLINTVPGYWTFSAMAKYAVTEKVSLQVNVTNLTDRNYIDQIHPAHVIPGEGRTAMFTANFAF